MADDFLHEKYLSSVADMIRKHPNCNIYRTNINLMNEKSEVFQTFLWFAVSLSEQL